MHFERRPVRLVMWTVMLASVTCATSARAEDAAFRVGTFEADITIPIGHACMGGGIADAKEIVDPLYAKGFVLLGAAEPVVVAALDWCQCNNDSYDRWRDALAEAAGTTRQHVLLAIVHQHDAPITDLRAQALLDSVGLKGSICDAAFHEEAVQRTAAALKQSLGNATPVTHVGVGQAKVERLASNRRVQRPDGTIHWDRGSGTGDGEGAPEGEVDPMLKTISLWEGDRPIVAWSSFAIHPMSYYGRGGVSADFVGRARALRQADDPGVFQIYFTGCSGDVTAGKYNDAKPANREVLARRLYAGMTAAWDGTRRVPLARAELRSAELRLPPRRGGDFEPDRMRQIMADPAESRWRRNAAAMGLSWRARTDAGRPIDVPCLDLGPAQFLVMPAETFVGYQLKAQRLRPDSFVMVAGFGDGAPGYIPTDACWKDGYRDPYCWVEPMTERVMTDAVAAALGVGR
jgi:hypothetical protein